jgi:septum formation protein
MGIRKGIRFILASKSPRRRELLEGAGYKFKVIASGVDEKEFDTGKKSPCEYAKELAMAKAQSVAGRNQNQIIVGADTIVDFKGRVIGKASDEKEAEQIVGLLFSRPHKVITALAIVRRRDNLEILESDTTIVYPRPMTEEQMAGHINSGVWRDKAGAYAIQEAGDMSIEKIEGSLTNVMGMPMELFATLMAKIEKAE